MEQTDEMDQRTWREDGSRTMAGNLPDSDCTSVKKTHAFGFSPVVTKRRMKNELGTLMNFKRLVPGCTDAFYSTQIVNADEILVGIGKLLTRSTRLTYVCTHNNSNA